ncbi:hypothetical protein AY601_1120 [Pedobacter cryoconitis]|uniref:Adhesin domain-containing protein n=1 Tax=Pedobacter cryoconitis TaxID=188932 RepID=A0A127VA09_9SPHI|nr:hypothetical protein [Pedobacter cryoconitis]AMP98047.1 hypothetical protein AY601_1120 [Pedobacter cryoconitis]
MKHLLLLLLTMIYLCKMPAKGQTTTLYRNGASSSYDTKDKYVNVKKSFRIGKKVDLKIIKNKFRNIEIRQGGTDSLTIVAKIRLDNSKSIDERGLWEKAKIRTRTEGSIFFIEPILTPDKIPAEGGATTLKSGDSNVLFNRSLRKNVSEESIIIYLPNTSNISIDSEFSDIVVSSGFKDIDLVCNNCFINIPTIRKVNANLKYSDLIIEEVDSAKLDVKLGTLNVQKSRAIDVISNITEIKLGQIKFMKLSSINDEIEIDSVDFFLCNKKNGYLRIKKLGTNFTFAGIGSDLTIERISPVLKKFDLKNEFAKVDISLGDLSNYQVEHSGKFSTLYAPFQFQKVKRGSKESDLYQSPGSKNSSVAINLDCNNCKIFLK